MFLIQSIQNAHDIVLNSWHSEKGPEEEDNFSPTQPTDSPYERETRSLGARIWTEQIATGSFPDLGAFVQSLPEKTRLINTLP